MLRRLLLFLGLVVVFAFSGYGVYRKFFSISSYGDKVFESIEKGRLYFSRSFNTYILIDQDRITTDRHAMDVLLRSGSGSTVEDVLDFQSKVFEIPLSIKEFRRLESSSYSEDLYTSINIDEDMYKDYYTGSYSSYDDFKAAQIKLYSAEQNFIDDSQNGRLIFTRKARLARLVYKVSASAGDYRSTLLLIEVDGKYKLGAMYSERI